MSRPRGGHAFQAARILNRMRDNKREFGCQVPGCKGGCAGYLTTIEAHEFALCPTARFDGMRKEGWEIVCVPSYTKNNWFHFLGKNAVQQTLIVPERLLYVGDVRDDISLFEVAA